ncbi:MAG TPA: preprotein translocase subunit SecE [Aggregatilineaceae bacterium]|nr:preprotein translocase subunit SecE [Aggregatilineaceae bacterium]
MARIRTRSLGPSGGNAQQKPAAVADRRRLEEDEDLEESQQPVRKDRPTPSAREIKPRGMGSTGLVYRIPVVRGVVGYIRGVASEMQKVTWPSRDETLRLTAVVLGVTIFFAAALGAMDVFLGWWFRKAFHANSEGTFLLIALVVAATVTAAYFALRDHI